MKPHLLPIFLLACLPAFSGNAGPRHTVDLAEGWEQCTVNSKLIRTETLKNGRKQEIYDPVQPTEDAKWKTQNLPCEMGRYPIGARTFYMKKTFDLPEDCAEKRINLHFRQLNDTFTLTVNGKSRQCGPTYGTPQDFDLTGIAVPGKNTLELIFFSKHLPSDKYLSTRGNTHNILPPAYVEITDKVYIADAAVDTRVVPEKEFRVRITLKNTTDKTFKGLLHTGVARQWNGPLSGSAPWNRENDVVIPANSEIEVSVVQPWKDAKLWTPDTPELYMLDMELTRDGKTTDKTALRFGFRHFQIAGHRFLLNGYPFTARSGWSGYGKTHSETVKKMKELKRRGHNTSRCFLPGDLESMLEAADEAGVMIVTCAETNNGGGGWEDRQNPFFWKQYTDHILAMVKAWRNHPSVILWGLGCEFGAIYCGEGTWREKSLSDNFRATGEKLMKLDPTRTWTEYGGVEAGCPVKGPGPAPTRSFHYPFGPNVIGHELPDIGYWYPDGRVSWHRINDRKKPTVIPEDLYHGMIDNHVCMAKFANDRIYTEEGYLDAIRYAFHAFAEGYYCGGLALWEPWMTYADTRFNRMYDNGWQPIPDYMFAMRPFHRNLTGGKQFQYQLYAYNQTFTPQDGELVLTHLLDGKEIAAQTKKLLLTPGMKYEETVSLQPPAVKKPTEFTLRCEFRGKQGTVLFQRDFKMHVFPAGTSLIVRGNTALLADLDSPLRETVFPKGIYENTPDAVNSGADRIIVTKSLTPSEGIRLSEFVRKGGRVLALDLRAGSWTPLQYEYQRPATFVWRRNDDRMKTVREDWFRSWRPDGRVTDSNVPKSGSEDMMFLFDSGHSDGLTGGNLAWLFRDKGAWLLCQLPLPARLRTEPAAPFILQAVLDEFTANDTPLPHKKVILRHAGEVPERSITEDNLPWPDAKPFKTITVKGPSYEELFRTAGIRAETNGTPDRNTVVMMDVSGGLTPEILREIDDCAEKGATVFVSEIPPDTDPELLKPFGVALKNPLRPVFDEDGNVIIDRRPHTAGTYPHWLNKKSMSGLLQGISDDDFFWFKNQEMWNWARYMQTRTFPPRRIKKDSSVVYADMEILPDSPAKLLTVPGGLAEMPYKKGTVILSTIRFKAFSAEYGRKVRYVLRTLLNNLGCQTSEAEKVYDAVCLDLSQIMNRNFWNDPKYQKKDGSFEPKGWFGDENDMRYFPVNLCGWSTASNNFCPKEKFPDKPLNLGGKTFRLTDPEQNGGKACIVLADGETVRIKPEKPMKMDQVFFLGASRQWEGALEISFNDTLCPILYTAKDHFNGYRYASAKSIGKIAWGGETPKDATAGLWFWKVPNPVPNQIVHTITLKNVSGKADHDIAIVAATAEQELH